MLLTSAHFEQVIVSSNALIKTYWNMIWKTDSTCTTELLFKQF